jgi:hypothetical protein
VPEVAYTSQFGQIGRDVQRVVAFSVHAADSSGGEDADTDEMCQIAGGSYSRGTVPFIDDGRCQIPAGELDGALAVDQVFELLWR